MSQLDPLTIATYIALGVAVIGLWVSARLWISALCVAVLLGYLSGTLSHFAVVWMVALAIACWLHRQPGKVSRVVAIIVIVCIVLQLGMHLLPGFHNPIIADDLVLSADAAPYDLYLNFDKTVAGILLLGMLWPTLIRSRDDLLKALRVGLPLIALNIVVLVIVSLALGYLRFDPKWTSFFWLWASVNLLSTCLSEEAFFRTFIQSGLAAALKPYRYGPTVALTVSAMLFGIAHLSGGWTYVLLSAVAGLGYGYIFQRTGRFEMAMLAHFALNATHFLLFTYPRAQ
jgi:hypothetical protein